MSETPATNASDGAAAPAVPAPAPLRRNRGFMLFWTGQSISLLGDQVSLLALPLIAVALLHASTFQVSALTAATWFPAILGVAAGTAIDRRPNKRAIMLGADLGRALILLSIPLAALLGHITLVQLYLVALLTGAISMLFNTTYYAFFARLVPQESYIAASSRLSTSQAAAYLAGPPVGGVLVEALTAPLAILADAASFLASAALIWRVRLPAKGTEPEISEPDAEEPDPTARSFRRELKQGWDFVIHDPVLRASLAGTTTINFFTFLTGTSLIVLFATRALGLSAAIIGVALGAGATGSLLGALLAGRVAAWLGVGRTVAAAAVLFPAPFALFAAAGGPIWLRAGVLGAAEFFAGVGVMLFDVNQNAILIAAAPDGMRARVTGLYSSINYGVRPAAALVGGLLAAHVGLRATFLAVAVGGSLSLAWFLVSPIPRIKTIDDVRHARDLDDITAPRTVP